MMPTQYCIFVLKDCALKVGRTVHFAIKMLSHVQ